MHFGNWIVTEKGIEWDGGGLNRFTVPAEELTRTRRNNKDNVEFYDWILLATAETWLTQNDLYDFNYAFVYAVAIKGLPFDYDIFDDTLEEQFNQFDIEDAENFDL